MTQKSIPKTKFSKSDIRFWEARVVKPVYIEDGQRKEASAYAIRIQAHGERRFISLREENKRQAAKSAMDVYRLVMHLGWEKGLAEFRGEIPAPKNSLTLGDYLEDVAATGEIAPRTLRTYQTKVRRIAADVEAVSLPADQNKFDHKNGGTLAWQKLVDRVPLRKLSPEAVLKWQQTYLASYRGNPAKLASATKTANSCIRAGKAIFAERIRERLPHLVLPDPVPFVGIRTLKEQLKRYRSEITNPEELLVAGALELASGKVAMKSDELRESFKGEALSALAEKRATRRREAFKVLILGLCAGLRRAEIDRLQWTQIDKRQSLVLIHATDCFAPKANSAGEIPIDKEVLNLIESWESRSTSRFVVDGVEPSSNLSIHHYRAEPAHVELIKWLKTKGITSRNPLHTLRKEFGSIVCQKAGVHVASRLLRHSNIQMTASVYADDRGRVTSGLGASFSISRS